MTGRLDVDLSGPMDTVVRQREVDNLDQFYQRARGFDVNRDNPTIQLMNKTNANIVYGSRENYEVSKEPASTSRTMRDETN